MATLLLILSLELLFWSTPPVTAQQIIEAAPARAGRLAGQLEHHLQYRILRIPQKLDTAGKVIEEKRRSTAASPEVLLL